MIKYKAHAIRDWSYDEFRLFLRGGDSSVPGESVVPEITFKTISQGTTSEPFLRGDEGLDVLQALVDAAFEYGVVPCQLEDHRSELKATKGHLEDMRKLTFGLLEFEGTEGKS